MNEELKKLTRRSLLHCGLCSIGALSFGCSRTSQSEPVQLSTERPDPDGSSTAANADVDVDQTVQDASSDQDATGESTHRRALLAAYPALVGSLPWIDLGGLPTTVTHAQNLGRHLGIPGLYIKRDDEAGVEYGGSKARKLEHILAHVQAQGKTSVLTFGGLASNHALATAVHAHRLGLGCSLLLQRQHQTERLTEHLLAEHRLGCSLRMGPTDSQDELIASMAERPYVIPTGGSSPIGNVGYVNAGFELARQCRDENIPVPDVIYIAAGTTGAAAGLFIGLCVSGLPSRLVAVRTSGRGVANMRRVRRELEGTSQYLEGLGFPEIELDMDRFSLEHGFCGSGYAVPSQEGSRAAELTQRHEGIELDPTYTAKAMAALMANAGQLRDQTVMFWNTYDPREVSGGDTEPTELPRAFQRYFRERSTRD